MFHSYYQLIGKQKPCWKTMLFGLTLVVYISQIISIKIKELHSYS